MSWFGKSEREKWSTPLGLVRTQSHLGLPALEGNAHELYSHLLPRGVPMARGIPDRPPQNRWMAPQDLLRYALRAGTDHPRQVCGAHDRPSR